MWIPASLLSLLNINRETVTELRSENASLRATNAILERELTAVKINSDWFRFMFNQLTAERTQLMAKAYPGLQLPAPIITRTQNKVKEAFDLLSMFEDQSEESKSTDTFPLA